MLQISGLSNYLAPNFNYLYMAYPAYIKYLFFCFLFFCATTRCLAWGADGHKLVARLAYSQLNQAVKDSLAKYLNGVSFEDASTWMDEVRSDKSYDYQTPWHYINIDKDSVYHAADTNIVWALKKAIGELKDRSNYSKAQIGTDIKIIIHLMGDLHQPLHVGYASDKGGNDVKVFYDATSFNLHRVWDSEIIKDEVLGQSIDWGKMSQFTPEEWARIRKIDIVGWMNESRALLDTVYEFKGDNLTRKYAKKNAPIIEHQILLASIRLAAVLKDVFGKG
jgi:hypothetical protein